MTKAIHVHELKSTLPSYAVTLHNKLLLQQQSLSFLHVLKEQIDSRNGHTVMLAFSSLQQIIFHTLTRKLQITQPSSFDL